MKKQQLVKEQNGWKFFNFPSQYTKKDHNEVQNKINAKAKQAKLNVFILIGNKKSFFAPGFSDIDYIVVTNSVTQRIRQIFTIDYQKGKTKDILYHDALMLSPKLAHEFGHVLGTKGYEWKLVSGRRGVRSSPSRTSIDFRILDDLIIHQARELYTPYFTKEIDIRKVIHKLCALRYRFPPWIRKDMGKSFNTKLKDYYLDASLLRTNWFNHKMDYNLKKIPVLIKNAIEIQEEGIHYFRKYLIKNYLRKTLKNSVYFCDPMSPLIFESNKNYLNRTQDIYNKYKLIIPVFPTEFSVLLTEYSKIKGVVSDHIKKKLKNSSSIINKEFIKQTTKRISYYNAQSDYCKINNLGYGPLIHFKLHEHSGSIKGRIYRKIKKIVKEAKIRNISNADMKMT